MGDRHAVNRERCLRDRLGIGLIDELGMSKRRRRLDWICPRLHKTSVLQAATLVRVRPNRHVDP